MKRIWMAMLPAAAACGPGDDGAAGPEVFTDTIGDTIVVRTLAGNVWGGDATLVPEVAIGELDGPEELLFGQIISIAVDDDRNVYVLDQQAARVRVFDGRGTHLRSLGRRGEGPGEFKSPEAVGVLPDGRVVVRDPGNMRVQLFGPGPGAHEAWRYGSENYFMPGREIWTDREGRSYVVIPGGSNRLGSLAVLVLGPDGTSIDTLAVPDDSDLPMLMAQSGGEGGASTMVFAPVPFSPGMSWSVHPTGGILSGVSTDYRIDVRLPDHVLRIERVSEPVPVSPAERDHHRERIERYMRETQPDWKWKGPSIPETKPWFRRLDTGRDGRIWVQLWTEGHSVENEDHDPADPSSRPLFWREPVRFDVFEADGRYLGVVNAPEGVSAYDPAVFDGDYVWAVTRDDLDVQRVVRYRIEVDTGR